MNMDDNGHGRGFFPGPRFDAPHGGGGSTLDWVIFALQLLMLAALAVLLARAFMRPRHGGPPFRRGPRPPGDPLEVARHRYARGELSRDDYLQIVRDLGGPEDEAPTSELPSA
jgi:uncharacterized membrane protein